VPASLRIWLPEILEEREAARAAARQRRQRVVALSCALVSLGAFALVEARLINATARHEALQTLIVNARSKRDNLLATRIGDVRRQANRQGLILLGRTLSGKSQQARCELNFRSGLWAARCRAKNWQGGAVLTASLGATPGQPVPALSGADPGWIVETAAPPVPWIGSPSR
jgi:hypothetical protein